jgi:hypothetical protein
MRASPSAVSGYNTNFADLLDQNQAGDYGYLNNNSGQIELTDYYSATTATATTPGAVAGYYEDSKLQQGKLGTPVLQDSKQYYAHNPSGPVDVQVTSPGGTSATSPADQFTYVAPAAPVVTGLSPASGVTAGGSYVTLVGSGFTGASGVTFGTTPVFSSTITVLSDSALKVQVPAAASTGVVDVTVITPGGTSATTTADQFNYVSTPPSGGGPPVITGIGPTSGSTVGGTTGNYSITLIGSGFTGASAVKFGSTAAASYTISVINDNALQVQVPSASSAGTVDVTVTTPNGTSATGPADRFTYVSPPRPVVTGLSKNSGSVVGGSTGNYYVTIIGSGFTGASAVEFGSTEAASYTLNVLSDNALQVQVPSASSVGAVDVTVTAPGGTSATSAADQFNYVAAPRPVVTGISKTSGSVVGGSTGNYYVSLIGSGFTGATGVSFGTVSAANSTITVYSDTALSVQVPSASAAGVVDVTVTTRAVHRRLPQPTSLPMSPALLQGAARLRSRPSARAPAPPWVATRAITMPISWAPVSLGPVPSLLVALRRRPIRSYPMI